MSPSMWQYHYSPSPTVPNYLPTYLPNLSTFHIQVALLLKKTAAAAAAAVRLQLMMVSRGPTSLATLLQHCLHQHPQFYDQVQVSEG